MLTGDIIHGNETALSQSAGSGTQTAHAMTSLEHRNKQKFGSVQQSVMCPLDFHQAECFWLQLSQNSDSSSKIVKISRLEQLVIPRLDPKNLKA